MRELLAAVDDRYVIMNAGDELRLAFPAPPSRPRPRGWIARDFVLIGDGWVKDGDYNTSFSKTVLPLPRHRPPGLRGRRPSDWSSKTIPVYRQHAGTGRRTTRDSSTPRAFLGGLR